MSRPSLRNPQQENEAFAVRVAILIIVMLLALTSLLGRFLYLQVFKYRYFQTQSESNRISIVPIEPSRGIILDRNGVVLARNYIAYTVEIQPDRVKSVDETEAEIGKLITLRPKDKKNFLQLRQESKSFQSLLLKANLSDVEVARLAASLYRLPGVEIKTRLFRDYPFGALLSHVIGYIGRINSADEAKFEADGRLGNYSGNTHTGKTGIEFEYENELHGTTGIQEVENDANGRAITSVTRMKAIPGNTLVLSLDVRLQQLADELFAGRRGALVAIDPQNGEVLAFLSEPGFDPNLFVDGIDSQSWQALNESPYHPLNNRALRGIYPPGSTFKPFLALAALESGVRKESDTIFDPGYFSIPGDSHRFRDDKEGGHGTVDMYKSLVESCDTYYYRLAYDLGINRIAKFMPQFGFGQKTGIDLDGESSGILPSPEWKQQHFAGPRYRDGERKWYAGDVVSVGIGQGYNAYTPLQMAFAVTTLANNAVSIQPRIVREIRNSKTGVVTPVLRAPRIVHAIQPAHIAFVKQALQGVMQAGGTAYASGVGLEYTMAGKTGTAQAIGIKQGQKYSASLVSELYRDHSWFIAFAPVENPHIAIAVLVENGGFGASAAAPIARKLFDFYLLGKRPPPIPVQKDSTSTAVETKVAK